MDKTNDSEDPLGVPADRLAAFIKAKYEVFRARWDSSGKSMSVSLMEISEGQRLLAQKKRREVVDLLKERMPEYLLTNDAPDGNFAIQVIAKSDAPRSSKLKSPEKMSTKQISPLAYGQ